jgi:hypothetical protein
MAASLSTWSYSEYQGYPFAMANPNEISAKAVHTHAIRVRSYARNVRSKAS